MKQCYVCDEPIAPDELIEFEGHWFHALCLREAEVVECSYCGEWFRPEKQ